MRMTQIFGKFLIENFERLLDLLQTITFGLTMAMILKMLRLPSHHQKFEYSHQILFNTNAHHQQ